MGVNITGGEPARGEFTQGADYFPQCGGLKPIKTREMVRVAGDASSRLLHRSTTCRIQNEVAIAMNLAEAECVDHRRGRGSSDESLVEDDISEVGPAHERRTTLAQDNKVVGFEVS